MADLSKLSDEELFSLKSQLDQKPAATKQQREIYGVQDLSDHELFALRDQLIPEAGKSTLRKVGDSVLGGVVEAGKVVDSYTGAPTRAFIGAAQDGKNPFSAYASQFGDNPDKAPTGKQIVMKAGVPETALSEVAPGLFSETGDEWLKFKKGGALDLTAAGTAGFAMDIAADPTNVIPVGALAKGVAKGAGKAASTTGKVLGKGAAKVGEFATANSKVASTTAEISSRLIEDSKRALETVFQSKQADDFPEMVSIAERHGIDPSLLPESIEFGENSFISRSSRAYREGPLGEVELEKFAEGQRQVQEAFNSKIVQTAGGAPADAVQAGNAIREGFDQGVEKFFSEIDVTHNGVVRMFPGLQVAPQAAASIDSALDGLEKFAKGRLKRGIVGKAEAQQLLDTAAAIRAGNGSYKQTLEALEDIRELAFKSTNKLNAPPVDVEKLRDLYFRINDALIGTVEKVSPDMANSLVFNNKAMSDFFKQKSLISRQIGDTRIAPEQVFNSLVINGTSDQLKALQEILPPEYFSQLKGAFLENLVKRDPDAAFNFNTLYSALRNKRTAASVLFTPDEITEVGELIKLGHRFGPPLLSSSGSSAGMAFLDLPKTIGKSASGRAITDVMKKSAREGAVSPRVIPSNNTIEPALNSAQALSRGGGRLLKGAQVLSVQPRNQEEDNAIQRRLRGQ